jgi:tRNA (guanosine-2'-O-)-methyltransferase
MPESRTPRREERVRQVLARRQQDLTLVMDNIWDPHNVSAILRSCDAFGVLRVHLYYTTEPWPDLGKKSSASAKKWVERVRHDDPAELVSGLRGRGFQILRTGFSDTARPPWEYDLSRPTAVILGNEHRGVSPELCALVPDEVFIPMQGMVQSFNVSVAAALILYEAAGQRRREGLSSSALLSPEELERRAAEWLDR